MACGELTHDTGHEDIAANAMLLRFLNHKIVGIDSLRVG